MDSTKVLFGASDGSVGMLSLKTKKKEQFIVNHRHGYPVMSISFNCNKDELLASGAADGSITVQSMGDEVKPLIQVLTDEVSSSCGVIDIEVDSTKVLRCQKHDTGLCS